MSIWGHRTGSRGKSKETSSRNGKRAGKAGAQREWREEGERGKERRGQIKWGLMIRSLDFTECDETPAGCVCM